jgi:enoyl-CoA hydratase
LGGAQSTNLLYFDLRTRTMKYLKNSLHNNILTITISRPESLNALNLAVLDELKILIDGLPDNPSIKGIIITGEGEKAFVAGADIKELTSLSKDQALALSKKGHAIFKSIENSAVPVVAAINGFALGGGCELAMACHIRLATENAKLGQPEVNLGIIPGYGGTQRLAQLVGRGKALELLLTGDMIAAEEAKSLGLVNHVVKTKQELLDLAHKILEKISTKGPIAVKYTIESVNNGYKFEDEGYSTEAKLFAECTLTKDFKEGTSAFIDKRQPQFKGE